MDHFATLARTANKETRTALWAQSLQAAIGKLNEDFPNDVPNIEISGMLTHWSSTQTREVLNLLKTRISSDINERYLRSLQISPMKRTKLVKRDSDAWVDFTFMDLFAGIGGFHLALGSQGGSLVFSSEIDNSAKSTYAMNFGVVPFGDIRSFTRDLAGIPLQQKEISENVPHADIIAGGFPCQPFSLAGVSSRNFHGLEHGLECEAQGTLFEDILLLARAIKPDALILENVRNLASHDSGKTIRVIRNEIIKSGYQIFPEWTGAKNWAVVNSLAIVAQRRKRVYMVCIRNDLAKNLLAKKGPYTVPDFKITQKFTLEQIIRRDDEMTDSDKFERFGISEKLWASHQRRDQEHARRNNGFKANLMTDLSEPSPTLVARYYKDGKDCLIPSTEDGAPPRMLTPRECALLQTFPKKFWIPDAKTPAYKQFGNAITVEIAREISRSLVKYLYA
jgi:DNA (cytosine-5)-methyltransferase 1